MPFILLEVIPRWGLRHPVSTMSHLLGAVLGVAALAALIWRAQRRGIKSRAVWALAVYGVSMALGFAASALFHTPILSSEELVLYKKLDHAAIFVMIAGTGTALYGALRTRWVHDGKKRRVTVVDPVGWCGHRVFGGWKMGEV